MRRAEQTLPDPPDTRLSRHLPMNAELAPAPDKNFSRLFGLGSKRRIGLDLTALAAQVPLVEWARFRQTAGFQLGSGGQLRVST